MEALGKLLHSPGPQFLYLQNEESIPGELGMF
jgi:hypothetical protein